MTLPELVDGELTVIGRVQPASNLTLVGEIDGVRVAYKPVSGERPLWDFPDGELARREAAAFLVSEATGWSLVPPTWLRDGPAGPGMVQRWIDVDPDREDVTLVPADQVPDGWCHVLDGLDGRDRPVSLIHADSAELRRMAVFDVIVNNADRKGGHVLAGQDGRLHGIDHGLTFHAEHKLRTVLWGWVGQPLQADEVVAVERALAAVSTDLAEPLAGLITPVEVAALIGRCERLLRDGELPGPRGEMPAVPWPPF